MKAIEYPQDLTSFKSSYVDIFRTIPCSKKYKSKWMTANNYKKWGDVPLANRPTKLTEMEEGWSGVKNTYFQTTTPTDPMDISNFINQLTVEDILKASFDDLVDIYYWYVNLEKNDTLVNELKGIFTYDSSMAKAMGGHTFVDDIANFFIAHAEELNISVCPYCELSYVSIIKRVNKKYRAFDLDHFLCKSDCPITALSLFNFVPSCQICNQKMKHDRNMFEEKIMVNGKEKTAIDPSVPKDKWKQVSPTNPTRYKFEEKVHIRYIPKTPKNKQSICFACDPGWDIYEEEIKLFGLNERYSFHYKEAERILNLKKRYPKCHRQKMSEYFQAHNIYISPEQIEEDIFGIQFREDNSRTMAKMYRDIFENK